MDNEELVKFALKHYSPPFYSEDEFFKDYNRIVVLKKLLKRYKTSDAINVPLVLNNIIILNNQFGPDAINVLLFNRVKTEHWTVVKTFLVFLNIYHETPETRSTKLDEYVSAELGAIRWQARHQTT